MEQMTNRLPYDLSHLTFLEGKIGQLQTLTNIPVVAGDSISLNYEGLFRLAALRRNLYMDVNVGLYIFYVPHRHVYSNWDDFIKQGTDEAITLGTQSITDGPVRCTGFYLVGAVPTWTLVPYVNIWNRYFRDPTDDAELAATYFQGTLGVSRDTGVNCNHLKKAWNTGVKAEVDSSDKNVSTAGDVMDLTDFAKQQGRLKSEIVRERFAQRYYDVLKGTWKAGVNIDADQRPELVASQTHWLSGYDVDATDTSSLGSYAGKAASVLNINMPMKFFPEHGSLMVMALLRFPPVHQQEAHYLTLQDEPTYNVIAGDPNIIINEEPIEYQPDDFFINGVAGTSIGKIPHSFWYREHPNRAVIANEAGTPFLDSAWTTKADVTLINPDNYDEVFTTAQARHWQVQARCSVLAKRWIPGVKSSIFAGTR